MKKKNSTQLANTRFFFFISMAIFPIRINELNFERKLIIKLSNLVRDGHIYQMNDNLTNETARIIKMLFAYVMG